MDNNSLLGDVISIKSENDNNSHSQPQILATLRNSLPNSDETDKDKGVASKGWKSYLGRDIKLAGIAVASVYMSVLGFDSITSGKKFDIFHTIITCSFP